MRVHRHIFRYALAACLALSLAHGSGIADAAGELPHACTSECATPYGELLGASTGGVEAYSNCRPGCVNPEPNYRNGAFTGIKWQCVEYARRWLLMNRGAVYAEVDTAADIWNRVDHLTQVATKRQLPLESHPNGAEQPPRTGDLLIYAKAFQNTGHVAVVTGVDLERSVVEIGEQNYSNRPWPEDHARKIELIKKGDRYWLLDAYLIGWKHAAD